MEKLTIVGLGGGGYTGGIYGGRYGLSPLLVGESDGGLITENPNVENFPGYPYSATGREIMENMKKQAESFGSRVMMDIVKNIQPINKEDFSEGYNIELELSGSISSESLLLALGTDKVKLGVPGEKEFFGNGVSYCATCDGLFFRGKDVAVVGGGDTALIEAYYLSSIVEKLYLIHRRNQFRGEGIRLERLKKKGNVHIITPGAVKEIGGESKVQRIDVSVSNDSDKYNEGKDFSEKRLNVEGVFIAVGTIPKSVSGINEYLETDEKGYLKVSSHQETNLPGVFAAGDFTTGSGGFRQLVTACGEGAVAAESAFRYLSKKE